MYAKPKTMFDDEGRLREFGTGPDRSIFTFGTSLAALAVLSSFVFAMGDLLSLSPPIYPRLRDSYAVESITRTSNNQSTEKRSSDPFDPDASTF